MMNGDARIAPTMSDSEMYSENASPGSVYISLLPVGRMAIVGAIRKL